VMGIMGTMGPLGILVDWGKEVKAVILMVWG
jgi:hypothetical protein